MKQMDREEALKILDTIPTIGEQVDALEMAITALEQQNNVPDTNVGKIPCEDAISRLAAQEAITMSVELKENPFKIWGRIQNLPSVNPQKTGRWVEVTDEETLTTRKYHYECSECGSHLKAVEKTRYCSECGALLLVDAKMQEE